VAVVAVDDAGYGPACERGRTLPIRMCDTLYLYSMYVLMDNFLQFSV